ISVGDYNSYYEEDPLDILRAANYNVLSSSSTYSYQFDGQLGSLDHAVVSNSMASAVTGIAKWNINAAEPVYLDYNDVTDDGGSDFANPFGGFYTTAAFRSSDHDPVIIGLNMATPLPLALTQFDALKVNGTAMLNWTVSADDDSRAFTIERASERNDWKVLTTVAAKEGTTQYSTTDEQPLAGVNLYRIACKDVDGLMTYSPVRKLEFGTASVFQVYPNPAQDVLLLNMGTALPTETTVQVTNILNQVVLTDRIESNAAGISLPVRALPAGIYNVRLFTAGQELGVKRFVKK
ncbi:MAG: T9SS type A sorting domain-containing protein, partial [Sphingobacteriales bacterium]